VTPTAASLIATVLTFVLVALFALWYAVPWMRQRPAATAIAVCLWVHAFRIVALQIFSARRFGFEIPLAAAQQIAWGDVVGAGLAVLGLILLRRGAVATVLVLWLFVIETALDLVYGSLLGVRYHAIATAHDLTWVILNFYVPVLWGSLALVVWQLITRRTELVGRANSRTAAEQTVGRPGA
jgi:hypothetical protein